MAIISGPINSSKYAHDLEPLGRKWFHLAEEEVSPQSDRLYEKHTSKQAFDYDRLIGLMGLAKLKPEGTSVSFDSMAEGPEKVYRKAVYANGFSMTHEAKVFAQQNIVMKNSAKALRISLYEKKEELLADVIDNAFVADANNIDGKAMCATDHPLQDGTTVSNRKAIDADLSEGALEQAHLELKEGMKDYRGIRKIVTPKFLVVPEELRFEQARILKTVGQVFTPDNTINAIRDMGIFKEETLVHERLTDADNWFMKTNVDNGLKIMQVESPIFRSENEFETFNEKFIGYEHYGYGLTNYLTMFGSAGS